MTEWEKAQNGYLYDANYDKEIIEARTRCADLCYEFNNCRPSDTGTDPWKNGSRSGDHSSLLL